MPNRIVTRQWLREEQACYSDARIAELVPAEGLTLVEVLDLDIPYEDRVWVLARQSALTPMQRIRFEEECIAVARTTRCKTTDAAEALRGICTAGVSCYAALAVAFSAPLGFSISARTAELLRQVEHLRQLIQEPDAQTD